MATEIKIPIADQTTEEVRIVKWRKAEGEPVAKGEVVLEVETDKSVIEVESAGEGVLLKRLYAENDTVPVGEVAGYVGAKGAVVSNQIAAGGVSKVDHGQTSLSQPANIIQEPVTAAAAGGLAAGVVEVKVPIADQTTEEVRIVKWRKSKGENVAKGEVVLEVETDKSVIEVESAGEGVILKLLCSENDTVPVGQVVGYVGPKGAVVASEGAVGVVSKTDQKAASSSVASAAVGVGQGSAAAEERLKVSPVARKTAAKLGVSLSSVSGSGPKGRIVKADVEQYATAGGDVGRLMVSPNARRLARELGVAMSGISGSGVGGRIVGRDVQSYAATAGTGAGRAAVSMAPAEGQPQPGTEVAVTKMRRAIGKNLQMSSRETPHFNVTMAIDMTRAIAFRKQINAGRDKAQRISVNDLVLKACAVALRQWPAVNSRLTEETVQYLAEVNIGVATALPTGLVVPVLTGADKKNWDEIAAETKRLAGEARNGKILGAGKGTFTVSNLGMFGVEQFTAIVNPPESAILAVGGVQDEVVAVEGLIGIRPIMRVTLCSDHRVIDGALAAQFLQSIKRYLENEITN